MAMTLSSTTLTYNDGSTNTTNIQNTIAGLAVGVIGSYAFCNYNGNAAVRAPGFEIAGSSLMFAGMPGNTGGTVAPSGSWRLMGGLSSYPTSTPKGAGPPGHGTTSVWLRYA
jgi:hypothetical protein